MIKSYIEIRGEIIEGGYKGGVKQSRERDQEQGQRQVSVSLVDRERGHGRGGGQGERGIGASGSGGEVPSERPAEVKPRGRICAAWLGTVATGD